MFGVSTLGNMIGSTDVLVLEYNDGIIVGVKDVEVIGISFVPVHESILGIDEGTEMGYLVSPSDG